MLHAVVLRMTMIRRMLLLMLTKKLNAMIKSSQIKSVRLCWQMRGGDVWRMLWRGDNSHRLVADTFSQIFTILSHVFSRVYSLAHTYIRHRHTHTRHRHRHQQTQIKSVLFPVWLSVTFSKVYSLAHTETQAHINTHPNTQAWVYIIETTIDQVWFSVSLSAMKRWRKT